MDSCSIDGCTKPVKSRGWCNTHYLRWYRLGDAKAEISLPRESCSVEDCEKPHKARGWCRVHYERWKRHGTPTGGGSVYKSPDEAFEARTEWGEEGCLLWTGAITGQGYGNLVSSGRWVGAHRFAWERENGPIPEGMQVDHTCYVRNCVNVDHLRLASPAQNLANKSGPSSSNTLGLRNVYLNPRSGKWVVDVGAGTGRFTGSFPTLKEALLVAEETRRRLYGEFAGRG